MSVNELSFLPAPLSFVLNGIIEDAKRIFSDVLLSITLFGSAAEGKLRSTSDVNLIIVLKGFKKEHADAIADSLRLAHAQIDLEIMFITETEIQRAAESFSVKFLDIESRHVVLYGQDYFTDLKIPPALIRERLRQILTNLILRLREQYIFHSNREEKLLNIIADTASPLRSAAFSILSLQNKSLTSPKIALQTLIENSPSGSSWLQTLLEISQARENGALPVDIKNTYFSILDIASFLLSLVEITNESV